MYHAWRSWKDGEDMTLCIGALSHMNAPLCECVVACFDTKVSGDEFGSESEYKFHVLSDDFVALISGRPGRAKELCAIYKSPLRNGAVTEDNVLDRLREPLGIIKRRQAEAYVQRKMAVSYQEFCDSGEKWFGTANAARHHGVIEDNQLGVDLIFIGFIGPRAILCELKSGEIEVCTNFSMIGSGAYTAEPALHARKQKFSTLVEDTVYNVYEAKRYGENSPSVGLETVLYIFTPPPQGERHIRAKRVTDAGMRYLAGRFKKHGPKPIKRWERLPEGTLETAYFNMDEGY
jgi:hypothetical protein